MRSIVRGVIGLIAGGVVLGVVAFFVQTDPGPLARAVKEIPFPTAWAQAQADIEDHRFFGGARFFHFFLVDGNPAEIADELRRIVEAADYTFDLDAPHACLQNDGAGGPTTCSLGAYRGAVHLWIVVWDRGETGPLLRGTPGLCVVRIQAGWGYS